MVVWLDLDFSFIDTGYHRPNYFPPLFLLCLRVSLLLALFGHCGRSAKTRIQSQGQMPWATHQLQSLRGWCLALGFGVSYHLIL